MWKLDLLDPLYGKVIYTVNIDYGLTYLLNIKKIWIQH